MLFKLLLSTFILNSVCVFGQNGEEGDDCINRNGAKGTCRLINFCKEANEAFLKDGFHSFKRCGFSGLIEIVCCVSHTDHATHHPDADVVNPKIATLSEEENAISVVESSTPVAQETLRPALRECKKMAESVPPPFNTHIIGGEDVTVEDFPHMGALGFRNADNKYTFPCGASLISSQYLVTAGHCMRNRADPGKIPTIVRLGVDKIDIDASERNDTSDYEIAERIIHPEYKPPINENDIALVKLVKPINMTESLHPACLFTKDLEPAKMIATGWGVVDFETYRRTPQLRKVELSLVGREKCASTYGRVRALPRGVTERMLCAGGEPPRDACQGDSGGPLQAITERDGHYRIIGITSFGQSCGTYVPGVYTRVASYVDWIESVVWPKST